MAQGWPPVSDESGHLWHASCKCFKAESMWELSVYSQKQEQMGIMGRPTLCYDNLCSHIMSSQTIKLETVPLNEIQQRTWDRSVYGYILRLLVLCFALTFLLNLTCELNTLSFQNYFWQVMF